MPSREMLEAYARVVVEVGLGLQPGDRVLVESPLVTVDFTRCVVEAAYGAGAVNVDVLWDDDAVARARFSHGGADAAGVIADTSEYRRLAAEAGVVALKILAEDPNAMAGLDVDRVARFQAANRAHVRSGWEGHMSGRVPWCVVGAPTSAWSRTVFPDADDPDERLWRAILRSCRMDTAHPVAAWRDHSTELVARRDRLTSRHYVGLRYDGPGTDLRVGLPDGARWNGGAAGIEGRTFIPNLPTEEVFTVPHRMQVEGSIRATKPLSCFGTLVEGFAFEVADGKVVAATAQSGQETLDRILGTDEASVRFGEMAMVPQSSAVAAEQLVWNNMLFDENDACHIALGMSYPSCVEGADAMDADERLAAGLNHSAIHVDFVVGSPELDVFGVRDDGSEEPIITGGEWGFTV